jgi:hypothetical protein
MGDPWAAVLDFGLVDWLGQPMGDSWAAVLDFGLVDWMARPLDFPLAQMLG